jgi:predicted glycosyltransferase involved in capsule biosynthesis
MNRLDQLKQTLLQNLNDNPSPTVNFILLDYNSSDGTKKWVKDNISEYIAQKKLIFYRENEAKFFNPAHSRNVCMKLGTGNILCNLDVDNFTGIGFSDWLQKVFVQSHSNIFAFSKFCYYHHMQKPRPNIDLRNGTHGRIALFKNNFMRMGGYNEDFIFGWGHEDLDLIHRCQYLKFQEHLMEEEHTTCIKHDDDKRLDNIDFSTLDAFLAKGSIQKESKKAKKRVSEQLHQQIGKKS